VTTPTRIPLGVGILVVLIAARSTWATEPADALDNSCPPLDVTCSAGLRDADCATLKGLLVPELAVAATIPISPREGFKASVCSIVRSSPKLRISISEHAFDLSLDYTEELAKMLSLKDVDLTWFGDELYVRRQTAGTALFGGALIRAGRGVVAQIQDKRSLVYLLGLDAVRHLTFNVRLQGRGGSWLLLGFPQGTLRVEAASTGKRTVTSANQAILDVVPAFASLTVPDHRKRPSAPKH
jgi:hypothetical protein